MKNLPIGFIDSGYGGLTVVRESLHQLPNESIIYFGDNARNPYGPKPLEQVKEYIWQITDFLLEKGIKLLVIACNTGTAAALEDLQEKLEIPVIGVIQPGSRSAIQATKNNHIGVIGTEGTIGSGLYQATFQEKADEKISVINLPCPSFVQMVENNLMDNEHIQADIDQQLATFVGSQVDTLVLGCTHYPMLADRIQRAVGKQITLVDPGVATIDEVRVLLEDLQLKKTSEDAMTHPPTQIYYTTGNRQQFKQMAEEWLNLTNLAVNDIDFRRQ